MAYNISMWSADGPNGEAQIKSIRIATVSQIPEIVAYWSTVTACVRITRERSEIAALPIKQLWIRDGYKDPFE
jgi:hypothetical protein